MFSPEKTSSSEGNRPIDIAQKLLSLIESGSPYRSDKDLLHPEVVFRDVMHFETSMGNGFATLLNYSDGMETFTRALLALPEVSAPKQCGLLFLARDIAIKQGIVFPESIPADWEEGGEVDYDLTQEIDKETSALDTAYWSTFGDAEHDIYRACLSYMQDNESILRRRNTKNA